MAMLFSNKKFISILISISGLLIIIGAILFFANFRGINVSQEIKSVLVATSSVIIQAKNVSTTETINQVPLNGVLESKQEGLAMVFCGGEKFLFKLVQLGDYSYTTDIYKAEVNPANFITRIKPSSGGGLAVFFVLDAPRKDCDRIYLTAGILGTDIPMRGIYVWQIGTQDIQELKTSKEFQSDYINLHHYQYPNFPYGDWAKNAISLDGEKLIIAQPGPIITDRWSKYSCNFRTLRLLNLRGDTSKAILELPEKETLDNGATNEGYCSGVNSGWLDKFTIYYDVYDAAVSTRPLKERRTIKL